ncbi:hypothetical protein ATCC90586_011737 [Pythium insidiosum]|nr:hypothetical protein ATCC90586_011737 [Pythium insidiosum]
MLPSPEVPAQSPPAAPTCTDSEYQPSQRILPVDSSSSSAPDASSEQTPVGPASPVTPDSPLASQDILLLLQRLKTPKPVPASLESSFKKVRHANKVAYLRWRDSFSRTDPTIASDLRTAATPEAACVALLSRPTEAVLLLQAVPHGLVLLAQLADATVMSLGRALICDVRLLILRNYAHAQDTPRRRATAVTAWITASAALSRPDARWNMLHDENRRRRLLPAALRARWCPDGLSDTDLCRLVLTLTVTLPTFDALPLQLPPAEQAAAVLEWISTPPNAPLIKEAAAELAERDWLAVLTSPAETEPLAHDPVDSICLLSQNVRGFHKTPATIDLWYDSFRSLVSRRPIDVVILQETKADADWNDRLRGAYEKAWGYEEQWLERPISYWTAGAGLSGGLGLLVHPHSALRNICPLWQDLWGPHFISISAC